MVEDEPEARYDAVAAALVAVVRVAVVEEEVLEVLEAELGVNHDVTEEVQHPAQGHDVIGTPRLTSPRTFELYRDVHEHERAPVVVGETVDAEDHEQHVITEEGLGHERVVEDAEDAEPGRVGHDDVVADAR